MCHVAFEVWKRSCSIGLCDRAERILTKAMSLHRQDDALIRALRDTLRAVRDKIELKEKRAAARAQGAPRSGFLVDDEMGERFLVEGDEGDSGDSPMSST